MICNKCNAQNDDAGKFCVKCGTPLSLPSLEQIAPKGKKSYTAFFIAILAILLIVTGGSYMLFFRGSAIDYLAPEGTTKIWQLKTGSKSKVYETFGGKTQFQGKTVIQIVSIYNKNVLGKKESVFKDYYEISDTAWKHVASQNISPQNTETGEIDLFEPPIIVFRYPLKEGYIWEEQTKFKDYYNQKKISFTTFKVLGMEEVEVPAGKFKAWKIEEVNKVDGEIVIKKTNWYAKNIGIVKKYYEFKNNKYSEYILMSVKKSGDK